jgi:cyclophilin family peptidyl-prolyl cis-trans isomerase
MKTRTALLITVSCMISFASQQLMAQEKTKKKATMTKPESAKEPRVKISTSYGDMVIKLYNETPQHRDNFLKLAQGKFYDSLLFHRVIKQFMIQGGDPLSKNASPTQMLGSGDNGYTIPAEFNPNLIHKKGALAAARTENPKKESSGCQFYIVQGKPMTDAELNMIEQRNGIKYTEAQRNIYKTVGGTPFLDMNYTVYGEVISGLDVIDKIAAAQTQPGDRPVQDVRMTVTVVK